jgi:hypothetical protein
MGKIPFYKVMTEQILKKPEVLLLCLRDKLGRYSEPKELSPRAETFPKVHLNDKRKHNLSMHNFTLIILNSSHVFQLRKVAIFSLCIVSIKMTLYTCNLHINLVIAGVR